MKLGASDSVELTMLVDDLKISELDDGPDEDVEDGRPKDGVILNDDSDVSAGEGMAVGIEETSEVKVLETKEVTLSVETTDAVELKEEFAKWLKEGETTGGLGSAKVKLVNTVEEGFF